MFSCNYNSNYRINNRKPPIIVVAIDSSTNSVILRDGNNQIFTLSNSTTTKAITKSLKIGDTVRFKKDNRIIEKF